MKTRPSAQSGALKTQLDICIDQEAHPVGRLTYAKDGHREYSSFAYTDTWLAERHRFEISPDLELTVGHRTRKSTQHDSCFFFALADTEPDAWGRRVIARAHAKQRKDKPELAALTELDYLCAVDDFSRIGALRLRDASGAYLANSEDGRRTTPPIIELERIMNASAALERGEESAEDLQYLQGKGTSLGGMRPKCSILDADGSLAIGKFPSIQDERAVTRGEVLALKLARNAGIDAAHARIVMINESPIAVISRFDRAGDFNRIPYLSAKSMLQANRDDEHAYTEIVDAINSKCLAAKQDSQQLWRRLVFNYLITNVDDHLQNLGFLHVGKGLWRLAPAFDLNPFPDKDRESKTWLSEDTGPITSLEMLLKEADRFYLSPAEARAILAQVHHAVGEWRTLALSQEIGLTAREVEDFAPAFEHAGTESANRLLA